MKIYKAGNIGAECSMSQTSFGYDGAKNICKISKRDRNGQSKRLGDIILIKDDNLPRCQWRLAWVSEVVTSADGFGAPRKIYRRR